MKTETITKIKKIAETYHSPEKTNASRILAKQGIYVDIAGIEWTFNKLAKFGKEKRKYLFGFDPLNLKVQLAPIS